MVTIQQGNIFRNWESAKWLPSMINEYIGNGQELQGKITVSSKVRSNNLDGSIFEIPEFIFILTFRKACAILLFRNISN